MPGNCTDCQHYNPKVDLAGRYGTIKKCEATPDGQHPAGKGEDILGSDGAIRLFPGTKVMMVKPCPLWDAKTSDGAIRAGYRQMEMFGEEE